MDQRLELENLPNEILAYLFSFVISDKDRINCRELVMIDDIPGLRKKYPRGEYGWINKTRSKFWPLIAVNKRFHEIILGDLKRLFAKRITFIAPPEVTRNCPGCARPSGCYCQLFSKSDILPRAFYLEVLEELEKFQTANPREYYEIIKDRKSGYWDSKRRSYATKSKPVYRIRILRWVGIKAKNSAQRAVIHKMAQSYGFYHYTYRVNDRYVSDYHQENEFWTYETQCEGCSLCLAYKTKKAGVLITDQEVTPPTATHNSLIRQLKKELGE